MQQGVCDYLPSDYSFKTFHDQRSWSYWTVVVRLRPVIDLCPNFALTLLE